MGCRKCNWTGRMPGDDFPHNVPCPVCSPRPVIRRGMLNTSFDFWMPWACCLVFAVLFTAGNVWRINAAEASKTPPKIQVFFSPKGGCEAAVLKAINEAKKEVLVAAYSFTSRPIASALIAAHKRGVDVKLCADDSNKNEATSQADELAAAGVPVRFDATHAISHSKYLVVDGSLVTTGSFNFSANAESSNWENLLVIPSKELAGLYRENWLLHFAHSKGK